MSQELSSVDKSNKNWLPWQRPLGGRKTNCRLIIYSRSSTNSANLAKIGPVDSEIAGLKGIAKMNKRQDRDRDPSLETETETRVLSLAGSKRLVSETENEIKTKPVCNSPCRLQHLCCKYVANETRSSAIAE